MDPRQLGLASGGGHLLPDAVRLKMEAALGADFSGVRVHVGPQAERIGAVAFTMGTNIYFAPGRFRPDTTHGQQLLGHELAHVVQQRAGRVRGPKGGGIAVVQDPALEAEADRLGYRAAAYSTPVQAKRAVVAQPSAPVRISPPIAAGPGSFRLTANAGGQQVGSVMVHTTDRTAADVTDLGVDSAHRKLGIGEQLLASAARAGLHFGKSKVSLAAQDHGSGRLTRWYQGMGFAQVGRNERGLPVLEAAVGQVLSAVAQRRMAVVGVCQEVSGHVSGGASDDYVPPMPPGSWTHRDRARANAIQPMKKQKNKRPAPMSLAAFRSQTPEALPTLKEKGEIEASKVSYSQTRAGFTYSAPFELDGQTVTTVEQHSQILKNKQDRDLWKQTPAIRVLIHKGKIMSIDNRRLYAHKKAGVKIYYKKIDIAVPEQHSNVDSEAPRDNITIS